MESSIVRQQLEQGAKKQDILLETAIEYYLTTGQYPTKAEIKQMGTAIDKIAQDKSFFEKAKSFASEHPVLSGLAVAGTVIGAVLLSRTKTAKALFKKLGNLFKETPEGKVGEIELANKRVRQAIEASNRKALPESPEFNNLPAVVKPDIYKDIKQFASKNTAVHAAMRRIARQGRGLTSEQAYALDRMLNKPPSIEDKLTQYMRSANN